MAFEDTMAVQERPSTLDERSTSVQLTRRSLDGRRRPNVRGRSQLGEPLVARSEPLVFEGIDSLTEGILYDPNDHHFPEDGSVQAFWDDDDFSDFIPHDDDDRPTDNAPSLAQATADLAGDLDIGSGILPRSSELSSPENLETHRSDTTAQQLSTRLPPPKTNDLSLVSAIAIGSPVALPETSPSNASKVVNPVGSGRDRPPSPSLYTSTFLPPHDEPLSTYSFNTGPSTSEPLRGPKEPSSSGAFLRTTASERRPMANGRLIPSNGGPLRGTAPPLPAMEPTDFRPTPRQSTVSPILVAMSVAFLISLIGFFVLVPREPSAPRALTIPFDDANASVMGSIDQAHLKRLQSTCENGILVVGGASDIETMANRRRIAHRRAQTAKDELSTLGVSPEQLEIVVDLGDHTGPTVRLRCRP